MNRRSLLAKSIALFGSTAFGQTPSGDQNFAESVQRIIRLVETIPVGAKRTSLDSDWLPDGGIQLRWTTRYKLRSCNSVKIDVDFENRGDSRQFFGPEDVIAKVSSAYLATPSYD